MPIQEGNIVFVESQVMDDVPEGGGAATGQVIVDGQMNNVFDDISDLDRAYGRFNLRKLFLAVRAVNTDLYGGAKTVITQLPEDPAVNYTMFTTNDPFDTRNEASEKVEAYLYKGPEWHGVLYGDHIEGMRAISVIQRVGTALPPIGKTLCLVQHENEVGEFVQYVRVTEVEATPTTFAYQVSGDNVVEYQRWVVRMSISDALRHDFTGHAPSPTDNYSFSAKTRIRDTTVADATLYYGSQPLKAPASIGDLSVSAASMFTQLVPSAQTETAMSSQPLASEVVPVVESKAGTYSYTEPSLTLGDGNKLVLRSGVKPGTLSFSVGGYSFDDGYGIGYVVRNGAVNGTIDYTTGEIIFNSLVPQGYSASLSVSYQPAAGAAQQSHQKSFAVTAENRRLNWLDTLSPIPAPRTISVAFMAQGNWYQLTDDGNGSIEGDDASIGAGTISYVTGELALTLGALPDADSELMLTWGSPVHYNTRGEDNRIDARLKIKHDVGEAIAPGTLVLTWISDSATKTATATMHGELVGPPGTSGLVVCSEGTFELEMERPPDPGTKIGIDYEKHVTKTKTFTGVGADGGIANLSIGEAVKPGSLVLRWWTQTTLANGGGQQTQQQSSYGSWSYNRTSSGSTTRRFNHVTTDAGYMTEAGNGVIWDGQNTWGAWGNFALLFANWSGGLINYFTGEITLPVIPPVPQQSSSHEGGSGSSVSYGGSTFSWTGASSKSHEFVSGTVIAEYTADTETSVAVSTEIDIPDLEIRVLPRLVDEMCVPNSLIMTWNGHHYVDRNGTVYRDIDPATGSGIVAGTIDYVAGTVSLSDYVVGGSAPFVNALLTRNGDWMAIEGYFRTQLAPLKPEAVSITVVAADGEQLTGYADADGNITGSSIVGEINYDFGTGRVAFGEYGPDPDYTGDGEAPTIWIPRLVDPGTMRYSAVAYSYLPLDAGILGIDPVRLPSDGRVPIFRDGGVVMVINVQELAPATYANGQTVSCGRTRVAWVRVLDAAGAAISGDLYTLDRANGTITFGDLTGVTQPLTVKHTVGDLRMITDAQISGQLTLSRALTHEYPVEGSLVAGCLIFGDRRARVSATWDQTSWDGTWVDYQKGSNATATLNLIDFPITVTNEGCDTDRWILRWTSSSTAELISEKRGLVWSGSYTAGGADIAPINPRTRTRLEDGTYVGGEPYMVIPGAANGGGWSAGNVLRINTIGAIADFWLARAIQQSEEPLDEGTDCVELYALGNIDRP